MRSVLATLLLMAVPALACIPEPAHIPTEWSPDADAQGHSAPTAFTRDANRAVSERLPLDDLQDFEDARRGLVASDPDVVVLRPDGERAWDTGSYDFVEGEAPASVNPSLWRQAKLNGIHGLFRVTEGIHQVRGYDLANLTLIDGETGWILVDPLTNRETATAALELARRHLGARPISAVILTHSHIDHFGGIAAVLPEKESARREIRIVAPAGFVYEATSENVLAGPTMLRRAVFMYGFPLARGPRGHVDTGLGKQPAAGTAGLTVPTDEIDRVPQEMSIDGVRFVFQYAPESEAPAELSFYLPDAKAFCGAELVSHTMHNLYTLRGAKVRDALRWAGYIDEAIGLFGEAEVVFASHHWPVWGNARVLDYLEKQRDTYKFIHDQALRLAGLGYTPREIASRIELPETLRTAFANRGYYGTVSHNAKAVYQRYFGWFDGNPANLDPLAPSEAGPKYVELMGGAEEVRRRAAEAFERGEYRWAAMLLNHLVFAAPEDPEARELLARTYDQLGYQAESGPWRDVYLTGAYELRHGTSEIPAMARSVEILRQVPIERFFDAIATRVDPEAAEGEELRINFIFTDRDESFLLSVKNSVLHHRKRPPDPEASATIKLTHDYFVNLIAGRLGLREAIFSDDLDIDGSRVAVLGFFSLLGAPDDRFAVVTP
jgi:alkyl sulfatase BDS1-like metallo-beta-lactamase superfamily hydrolase